MAPRPPAFGARDEKRDAGVALPPALVRALQLVDDRRETRGLRRVGDVPDLVRRVAVGAQQIDLALAALGQLAARPTPAPPAPPPPRPSPARLECGRDSAGSWDRLHRGWKCRWPPPR